MGRFRLPAASAVLTFCLVGSMAAQDMGPPAFLQIFREREKVGRSAAHEQAEAAWPRAFARAKIKNYYMGLVPVYGPHELWFVEGNSSIAQIEAENKAIAAAPGLTAELNRASMADAANIDGGDMLLARYLPEASNPGTVNVGEQHIWEITIFRIRPGKEASFYEGAGVFKSVVQKAGVDAPWAAFQIMAGMPGPTFLVFSPHKSLADIDPTTGTGAAIEKAITQDIIKQFSTLSENFISTETRVFMPNAEMSYPMDEWVKADPKFWAKKPVAPKP